MKNTKSQIQTGKNSQNNELPFMKCNIYSNLRIEAMITLEMIEQFRRNAKKIAKKIEQEMKVEIESELNNLIKQNT